MKTHAATLALVLALAAPPALATWSIVAVNTATGEVCVASATCIANTNLEDVVPVLVPGVGAGAVQSSTDSDASKRNLIKNGLLAGKTPQEILDQLALLPDITSFQYGIVDMASMPVTHSGSSAGNAKHGKAGIVGDVRYAIQGNVLAGKKVINQAELALVNTPGDLSQKVMAAMEAARFYGGDGRCSCSFGAPNSCGSPPPGFTHSALTAFIALARVGDPPGVCNASKGCANGNYYLLISTPSGFNKKPPVPLLAQRYQSWRKLLSGRPDAILSTVDAGADSMPADGVTTTPVSLRLIDLDGVPLTGGGAKLVLKNLSGQPDATVPGPVTDHGDGSYSFDLTAGTTPGTDVWRILVDDQQGKWVRLYPPLTLRVDPVGALHVGRDTVSAAAGGWVPLTLNPGSPNAFYRVLASASGTSPGAPFQGTTLPLNRDPFMTLVSTRANSALLPNARGFLDAAGHAQAAFAPPPGMLTPFVGTRLEWSALVWEAGGTLAAAPAGFDVLP